MKHVFVMFQFQSFKFLVFAFLCVFLFYPKGFVFAISYTVSPMVIDTKAVARDIITKDITITNTGETPVTVYPSVNEISLKEGGTIEAFKQAVESDRTKSVTSWIEISRLGIDLQPGTSKTIPLTIRMNPSPVPNTYHAFIGFGYGGNRDEAERQVANGQAPGTVITITIAEENREFLKLSKFIVERFVTSSNNQAATFTFTNPGDEVMTPTGEIILYDSTGKEVGALPVNTENVSIQPKAEHTFTASIPAEGKFGKYKAFLTVEYGSTQRASLQDTSFFYIFPLRMLIIMLSCFVIFVSLCAWYVHRRYFDDDMQDDDHEHLTVHVRDGHSTSKGHDLHLTKPS